MRKLPLLCLLVATPLCAGYAARDLVLPVAGRAVGSDGRLYLTAVWITNAEARGADVTLLFHPAGDKASPRATSLQLAPNETRVFDPLDASVTGSDQTTGWLRITATRNVLATARVYSRYANETIARSIASSFRAVPAEFAVGNGESAILQGVAPDEMRYKLSFAEISGQPLQVDVVALGTAGNVVADKRMYIDKNRQITADVTQLFPHLTTGYAVLRVDGVNGKGRVVVAGSAIAKQSQDATAFEMSFTPASRNRIGGTEAAAYIVVGLAAIAGLFLRR